MNNSTDRQQTGVWFVITGILLLSFWVFSYAIVNWAIGSGFIAENINNSFTNEQQFVIGGAGIVAVQLASLTGVPFVITGVAQIIIGAKKTKKSSKKK